MEQNVISGVANSRPYRSHRVPACSACRKRKIRCQVDSLAQHCRFCRGRQMACDFSYGMRQFDIGTGSEEPPRPRTNLHGTVISPAPTERGEARQVALASTSSPSESSPLLMNPTMAEDVDILERYLTTNTLQGLEEARPYIHVSHTGNESIVYYRVPRHRKGLRSATEPGKPQREILEQVLASFKTDVIRLYFDYVHPCFPILDETGFWELWQKDADRISPTLICDIYALAMLYWSKERRLQKHPRPDLLFAWNQAVIALRDDFMAPSITTLYAVLLDITGRPVLHVAGNIANVGRTVTLAHSLGLHRDPSSWKATQTEKNLRIRTWWGVLVHDLWASLSHGTPPNINPANYDVPLPSADMSAATGWSELRRKSLMSFIHLCSLTRILEEILPLVYTLHPNYETAWKNIRRIEYLLDEWEDALPDYLNLKDSCGNSTNGASNLWFCYLSLKLLVYRLAFRMTSPGLEKLQSEAHQYRLALLRDSASKVVEYVTSLQNEQFHEFWLPYTAHLLVSATVVLLRCIIESSERSQMKEESQRLVKLLEHLRAARDLSGWDLADFCLERCTMPIEKIAASVIASTFHAEPPSSIGTSAVDKVAQETAPTTESSSAVVDFWDDVFLPTDSFDYPWEMLWEKVEGLCNEVS